ncbi:unnamed protein product [Cyprideis torosa]|uniref:[histone H3]-dimethyl-L-lysine(9) demethylase n=1 Tax=Cyprideis torosa TaxID=163714 RepID=A0A7R8WIR7_9CRUS|nr:unnamed protein product [Cyprideis torosa]CAG0894425.1 unnamed protein product [Cyprideis torosa]
MAAVEPRPYKKPRFKCVGGTMRRPKLPNSHESRRSPPPPNVVYEAYKSVMSNNHVKSVQTDTGWELTREQILEYMKQLNNGEIKPPKLVPATPPRLQSQEAEEQPSLAATPPKLGASDSLTPSVTLGPEEPTELKSPPLLAKVILHPPTPPVRKTQIIPANVEIRHPSKNKFFKSRGERLPNEAEALVAMTASGSGPKLSLPPGPTFAPMPGQGMTRSVGPRTKNMTSRPPLPKANQQTQPPRLSLAVTQIPKKTTNRSMNFCQSPVFVNDGSAERSTEVQYELSLRRKETMSTKIEKDQEKPAINARLFSPTQTSPSGRRTSNSSDSDKEVIIKPDLIRSKENSTLKTDNLVSSSSDGAASENTRQGLLASDVPSVSCQSLSGDNSSLDLNDGKNRSDFVDLSVVSLSPSALKEGKGKKPGIVNAVVEDSSTTRDTGKLSATPHCEPVELNNKDSWKPNSGNTRAMLEKVMLIESEPIVSNYVEVNEPPLDKNIERVVVSSEAVDLLQTTVVVSSRNEEPHETGTEKDISKALKNPKNSVASNVKIGSSSDVRSDEVVPGLPGPWRPPLNSASGGLLPGPEAGSFPPFDIRPDSMTTVETADVDTKLSVDAETTQKKSTLPAKMTDFPGTEVARDHSAIEPLSHEAVLDTGSLAVPIQANVKAACQEQSAEDGTVTNRDEKTEASDPSSAEQDASASIDCLRSSVPPKKPEDSRSAKKTPEFVQKDALLRQCLSSPLQKESQKESLVFSPKQIDGSCGSSSPKTVERTPGTESYLKSKQSNSAYGGPAQLDGPLPIQRAENKVPDNALKVQKPGNEINYVSSDQHFSASPLPSIQSFLAPRPLSTSAGALPPSNTASICQSHETLKSFSPVSQPSTFHDGGRASSTASPQTQPSTSHAPSTKSSMQPNSFNHQQPPSPSYVSSRIAHQPQSLCPSFCASAPQRPLPPVRSIMSHQKCRVPSKQLPSRPQDSQTHLSAFVGFLENPISNGLLPRTDQASPTQQANSRPSEYHQSSQGTSGNLEKKDSSSPAPQTFSASISNVIQRVATSSFQATATVQGAATPSDSLEKQVVKAQQAFIQRMYEKKKEQERQRLLKKEAATKRRGELKEVKADEGRQEEPAVKKRKEQGVEAPATPLAVKKKDDDASPKPPKIKKKNSVDISDKVLEMRLCLPKCRPGKFVQDVSCLEISKTLDQCSECYNRMSANSGGGGVPVTSGDYCRFVNFRKLRTVGIDEYKVEGFMSIGDDVEEKDVEIWSVDSKSAKCSREAAKFLLTFTCSELCRIAKEEEDVVRKYLERRSSDEGKEIAYKRQVERVRELCDACSTTIFNTHWFCSHCGLAVCPDCYRDRFERPTQSGSIDEKSSNSDEHGWPLCTKEKAVHVENALLLAQIIPGECLRVVSEMAHSISARLKLPHYCSCELPEVSNSRVETSSEFLEEEELIDSDSSNDLPELKMNMFCPRRGGREQRIRISQRDKLRPELSHLPSLTIAPNEKYMELLGINLEVCNEDSFGCCLKSVLDSLPPPLTQLSREWPAVQPKNIPTDVCKGPSKSTCDRSDGEYFSAEFAAHFPLFPVVLPSAAFTLPLLFRTKTATDLPQTELSARWLCDGGLLQLTDTSHSRNVSLFQEQWRRGQPIIVSNVGLKLNMDLWTPEAFSRDFGHLENDLVNCLTGNMVPKQPMKLFWDGFDCVSKRLKDKDGNPMLLKLKDWPPGEDFADLMPRRFKDLMAALPMGQYTRRNGRLNLAGYLPQFFSRPDLGPKMYIAYGSATHPNKGTTNLHLDISDAVNVMVYVGIPDNLPREEVLKGVLRGLDEAGCDVQTRRRVREAGEVPGALWHIYNPRDSDKIRDLLRRVQRERGIEKFEYQTDPIHDQSVYLDGILRERLYNEYGVEGYAIAQCMGDSVFIPAGAPHQVRNLHNCIKVAEDFVSPENVSHCLHLTKEFRNLSDSHTNHEDKLQIKNIIYHATKAACKWLSKESKYVYKPID